MFIGHFDVGFGAKAAAKKTSLGTLFLAAQFLDLLWPSLLMLGLERVEIDPGNTAFTPLNFVYYPISHNLLAMLVWAVLFGTVYGLIQKYPRGALICGLVLVSHWVLDLVTHRSDLPLYPGGVRVGLGLWHSVAGTMIVEVLIFAPGVWLYLWSTQAKDRVGSIGLWGLVGLLLLIYLGNVFGDPPPSAGIIAWVGQAQWLLIAWGYWVDRHRQAASGEGTCARAGAEGPFFTSRRV